MCRRSNSGRVLYLLVIAALIACTPGFRVMHGADAGSGTSVTGQPAVATRASTGSPIEIAAGVADAADGGTSDAGTPDAGLLDAGTTEAGIFDAGTADAGPSDTAACNTEKDDPNAPVYVTTVAGNDGYYDGTGGRNGTAQISVPWGIAVDSQGNVYVSDYSHHIRRIDPAGKVTTVAGTGVAGYSDGRGGPCGTAEFSYPAGVALDGQGDVIVADAFNNRIRKVAPSGDVTTLAGNGIAGFADGTGGPSGTAEFNRPEGVAVDARGNIYVADSQNARIRKIDAAGNVTTLAGNGTQGFADGAGGVAQFNSPAGVAVDAQGNVYVADTQNDMIRKIDPSGTATTIFGYPKNPDCDWWSTDCLYSPMDVAVDAQGVLYVTGTGGNVISRLDQAGHLTILAGSIGVCGNDWTSCPEYFQPNPGDTDGPGPQALFSHPQGIAVDAQGNLYVSDSYNSRVRKIDPSENVTTLAGNLSLWADGPGGPYGIAQFNDPEGVVADDQGNLYVADRQNNRIRKIDPSGNVTTLAGNGIQGSVDGTGGPNGTAEFFLPDGIALDSQGNLYVTADNVRKIDRSGNVTTLGGSGTFLVPRGPAVDARGNIYVADTGHNRICSIDPGGTVTVIAGNGTAGWADGTGGPNGTAEFYLPSGVAVDAKGTLYVADRNRIRKIDGAGNVTTFAGNGLQGWADGTGGPNGTAEFGMIRGLAVDSSGKVYVADDGPARVREVDTSGNVTSLAGTDTTAWPAWADGIGGLNGIAQFEYLYGIAVDPRSESVLYVSDGWGNRIRRVRH